MQNKRLLRDDRKNPNNSLLQFLGRHFRGDIVRDLFSERDIVGEIILGRHFWGDIFGDILERHSWGATFLGRLGRDISNEILSLLVNSKEKRPWMNI